LCEGAEVANRLADGAVHVIAGGARVQRERDAPDHARIGALDHGLDGERCASRTASDDDLGEGAVLHGGVGGIAEGGDTFVGDGEEVELGVVVRPHGEPALQCVGDLFAAHEREDRETKVLEGFGLEPFFQRVAQAWLLRPR
jgi:hypothetical protein